LREADGARTNADEIEETNRTSDSDDDHPPLGFAIHETQTPKALAERPGERRRRVPDGSLRVVVERRMVVIEAHVRQRTESATRLPSSSARVVEAHEPAPHR
jgi:hypothetical protein